MYVLCTVAFNVLLLAGCLTVEMYTPYKAASKLSILPAINRNQLALFLLVSSGREIAAFLTAP